jgi:hypothetical protein
MEKGKLDRRRALEILTISIFMFLILIFVLVYVVFSRIESNSTDTGNIVSNKVEGYTKYSEVSNKISLSNVQKEEIEYLDFKSRAEHQIVLGFLGQEIDKYIVYVKNTDYKPGYFNVYLTFKDYYGNEEVKIFYNYIEPFEEESYTYSVNHRTWYDRYFWKYEVISETKKPLNNYNS